MLKFIESPICESVKMISEKIVQDQAHSSALAVHSLELALPGGIFSKRALQAKNPGAIFDHLDFGFISLEGNKLKSLRMDELDRLLKKTLSDDLIRENLTTGDVQFYMPPEICKHFFYFIETSKLMSVDSQRNCRKFEWQLVESFSRHF